MTDDVLKAWDEMYDTGSSQPFRVVDLERLINEYVDRVRYDRRDIRYQNYHQSQATMDRFNLRAKQ